MLGRYQIGKPFQCRLRIGQQYRLSDFEGNTLPQNKYGLFLVPPDVKIITEAVLQAVYQCLVQRFDGILYFGQLACRGWLLRIRHLLR